MVTMANYSDYCPIAVGVDVLGDRWTPLIIRELMVGSSRFNEIHRGVPKMSRTLLAQRLRTLERRGLVTRQVADRGRAGSYSLTPAGEGLTPIVWAMGNWAAEWVFSDPDDDECDGLSLMWRMHQVAIPLKLPIDRTVVHMVLSGAGAAEGWLGIENRQVSVCKDDPGYDVDLAVQAETKQLQRWVVGLAPFRELVRDGSVRLLGPSRLVRAFPTWFDTSLFAEGFKRSDARKRSQGVA
jgi:DNA-binding HxlR family transcriptional regulator